MAKYQVVHSCGHEVTHQLYGKTSDRERKIKWLEYSLCPDCYKEQQEKERQEKNNKAAAENAAAGLPPLEGTEKQVAWAETIRSEHVTKLEKIESSLLKTKALVDEDCEHDPSVSKRRQVNIDAAQLEKAVARIEELGFISLDQYFQGVFAAIPDIQANTSASWWIDNRYNSKLDWMKIIESRALELLAQSVDDTPAAEDAKEESLLRPKEQVTAIPAEISIHEKMVAVKFPKKNRDFWEIIKPGLGFTWSGKQWEKTIGIMDGSAVDRAAEAGHRLLAAGFPVIIWDNQAREMAVSGEYEPLHTRWIAWRPDFGRFIIKWNRRKEDFYKEARMIDGSRWSRPYVTVPPEQYLQVLDFAEQYDFRLSPQTLKVIEEQKKLAAAGTVVDPAPLPDEKVIDTSRPELDPDQVDGEIDADLLDD